MTPDELCDEFAGTGLKISDKDLDDLVLIEGEPEMRQLVHTLPGLRIRSSKSFRP